MAVHKEFQRFQQGFWQAVDVVLPPRCPVTGEIVDRQGMIAPAGWSRLEFISAPFCCSCGVPFDYEPGQGAHCTRCLSDRPPFASARAALVYDEACRDMILRFKHADKLHALHSFVPWLQKAGRDMLIEANYIVPVPLHRMRLLRRRYNQSALLARGLSRASGVPCLVDGLRRDRATPSQARLGFKERQKNVKKAFSANPACAGKLKGARIVLVDDVYTTGATVKECCRALLAAGAAEIHVLTIARVKRAGEIF